MPLTVNTNVSSINAQRNLKMSQASLSTSLQRLSSGLRINSAKDDAAGLAISERFTAQIRGNEQAARNANDGISLAQTAEGSLVEISNNLQRMRELAVQSSNSTNSDTDRAAINNEVQALATEIDRVAQNSSFNGTKLLDGSFTAKNFQVGANNTANDSISITAIASARTSALGGVSGAASASVTGAATTTALAAGDVTLNGIQVGASTTGAGAGQSAASAYSIAHAINAVSGQSGVTASAQATTVTGGAATAFIAVAANAFSINGVNVGAIAAGGDVKGQGANTAAAINAISSQTGVIATANATTGVVTLGAADGRDITITGVAATVVAGTGLVAAPAGVTTHGTVNLEATSAITVSGGAVASAGLALGTTAATVGAAVSTIATMNVLTAASSLKALDTIDGALATINSSRAALGAYQTRFASVVANQQTTVENLSASRGRIQDADFAKETANLSRAQVLQQAGTAMLSQANQAPQSVLALLR